MTVTADLFNDATAKFSPCGRYRYRLGRSWRPGGRYVLFVMLNPSIADEFVLDPTVRRCVDFAHRWGFDSLEVCNLFALRSTDPKALYTADDPIGPENDRHIMDAAVVASMVVCAWGVHGAHRDRGAEVRRRLGSWVDIHCLGTTKDGHPKHPLYLAASTQPQPF